MTTVNKKHFNTVLALQIITLGAMATIAFTFWATFCDNGLDSCITAAWPWSPLAFLAISLIRPLLFTPIFVIAIVSGNTFPPMIGTLLTAAGATLGCLLLFMPGKYLGSNGIRPWLSSNLPATWQLMKTQDYKIVFLCRWLPLFPFDLMSLLFGVADFSLKRTLIATFFGVIPEAYIFHKIANSKSEIAIFDTIGQLALFGLLTMIPALIYEFIFRKKGSSLWLQIRSTYNEIVYEVRTNNEIIRRRSYDQTKTPVILLYGFFSSRKVLTIMERLLTQRGFQVMSFNLGGLLGVFFTRGIRETARHIDNKIERQMKRYGFKKVNIVAHSKGGMVALWWILKLGGNRYCEKVITMGTPFKGTYLTYLGLVTPIGFFWRDLWQMRPNSQFLRELHDAEIPANTSISCLYSEKDKVATGQKGIYIPSQQHDKITRVPMHHVSHFEFLYRRDVADSLARILRQKPNKDIPSYSEAVVEDLTKHETKS